ncbi:hypothetical protein H9X96_12985 [Pedobacter sp. N36a]|nr:hypothetical protein [Pedobacter sp. N36a]
MMDHFYGLKPHLIVNDKGGILNLVITQGNVGVFNCSKVIDLLYKRKAV